MQRQSVLYGMTLAVSLGTAVAAALAHGGATGIVGERMNGMMDMARSVKALSEFIETEAVDPAAFEQAVALIEQHAGETMLALFPEGSIEGPSDASPTIWSEWQAFSGLAIRLENLAGDLRTAPARVAKVATPQPPVETTRSAPKGDVWASLDERALLGLKSEARMTAPEIARAEATPATRQEVFAEITQTCASCHEQFRRAGS